MLISFFFSNCLPSGSKWTSVEIERNDSGLGSETGGKLKRRPARVSGSSASNSGGSGSGLVGPTVSSGSSRNLLQGPVSLSHAIESEQICEDCDQVILPMGVEQQELRLELKRVLHLKAYMIKMKIPQLMPCSIVARFSSTLPGQCVSTAPNAGANGKRSLRKLLRPKSNTGEIWGNKATN